MSSSISSGNGNQPRKPQERSASAKAGNNANTRNVSKARNQAPSGPVAPKSAGSPAVPNTVPNTQSKTQTNNQSKTPSTTVKPLPGRIDDYARQQEAIAQENANRIRQEANRQAQSNRPPTTANKVLPGSPKELTPDQSNKLINQNNENTRDARVGLRTGDAATLQDPKTLRNNNTPQQDVGEMRLNQAAEESGVKKELPGGEEAVSELNRRLEAERQENARRREQGLPPVRDPELHAALDLLSEADKSIKKTGDDLNQFLGGAPTPSSGLPDVGSSLPTVPSDSNMKLIPLPSSVPEGQGPNRPLTAAQREEVRKALEAEEIQDEGQSRYGYGHNPELSQGTKNAIGDPSPKAPDIRTVDPFNPKTGLDKLGYVPEGAQREKAIRDEAVRQRLEAAELERRNAETRSQMDGLIGPKILGGAKEINENQRAQTQQTQGAVNDLTGIAVQQQNDANAISTLRDSQQFNREQHQSNQVFKSEVHDLRKDEALTAIDLATGLVAGVAESVLTAPGRSAGKQVGKSLAGEAAGELGETTGKQAGKQFDEAVPSASSPGKSSSRKGPDFDLTPPKDWTPDPEETAEMMPFEPEAYPRANPAKPRPLDPDEVAELPKGMTPEQGALAKRPSGSQPETRWSETDKRRFLQEQFPKDTPQSVPEQRPFVDGSADPKNNTLSSHPDVDGLLMRHEANHHETFRDAAVYQAWYESLTPEQLNRMNPRPEPPPYKVSPELVESAKQQGKHLDEALVDKGFEASYDLSKSIEAGKNIKTPEGFNRYRFSYDELAADMTALKGEMENATDPAVKAELQRRYDNLAQIWKDIESGKIDLNQINGDLPPAPIASPYAL
jgi:hypothetical protein